MDNIISLEVELKLSLLQPEAGEKILSDPWLLKMALPEYHRTEELESVYYDTRDHGLLKKGLTYRIRREKGQWTATVKSRGILSGGLHKRQEINVPSPSNKPSLELFTGTPVWSDLVEAVGKQEMRPLFRTVFCRDSMELQPADGSRVLLAVDRGEIIVGRQREPIEEIELELLAGTPAVLSQIAQELMGRYPLKFETESKYLRGLKLAKKDIS